MRPFCTLVLPRRRSKRSELSWGTAWRASRRRACRRTTRCCRPSRLRSCARGRTRSASAQWTRSRRRSLRTCDRESSLLRGEEPGSGAITSVAVTPSWCLFSRLKRVVPPRGPRGATPRLGARVFVRSFVRRRRGLGWSLRGLRLGHDRARPGPTHQAFEREAREGVRAVGVEGGEHVGRHGRRDDQIRPQSRGQGHKRVLQCHFNSSL